MYGSKNGDKRKYYELSYEEARTEYYRFRSSENWEKSSKVLRISLWLDNAMFGNLHIFVIDFDKIDGTVETESVFFKEAKELADKVTRSQGGGYHMFYGVDKEKAEPLFDSINLLASENAASFVCKTGAVTRDGANKVDLFCDTGHFIYEWEPWDNTIGLTDKTRELYQLTVTYQYEGTVPDGAPTVPAKVDSWYGANVPIAEVPTLAGYVFSGWTTDTAGAVVNKGILIMPNADVVLKGTWTKDVAATAMVTFRIVNGTWADGSTADKQTLIRLHDGKGTLDAVSIPTGMKANSGYTGGVWDVQPNTSPDAVTGDVVYTYSFKPNKPGMTYRVMFKFVSLTKDENGQPKELPRAVQDLLPASITGLKRNDTVIYPILDKTSVSVADGTWVFAGWPGGTSATITGNILEVGGWRFEAAPKVFFPTMGIMIEGQRIDVPAEGPVGSNANLPEMFRPITITLGTVERSFASNTVGGAGSPLTIRFTNYPDSQFSEGDYPLTVGNLPEGYTYELLVNDNAVQSPIHVDDNLSNIMLNIRKTYTLAYDTNGGNTDGPAAQSGLLPDTYPLSATKPTHASVDGKAVVWIGWTAEQDTAIYERETASFNPSHLLTTVTISNKDETVYALWGYDENGNGTADVLEQTATITFRIANGTWADGSTADKQILILLHEGKGTLDAADIPTGMKADSGYTGGTWDRQPDTTADAVTGNLLYTYSLNWFQCQGQFFDSNRYKITTVTVEKSVSTAWPPY